jgi:Y-X(10)_GDL-associated radical SAM protein
MTDQRRRPVRLRTAEDFARNTPVHVVWEITLACNLKCRHCGSRAGKPRPGELDTAEALDVIEQLARLGTREITLIGGEAYLRRDWLELIRAIHGHGIYCAIQTGARHFHQGKLEAAAAAGLDGLGVSVDGLAPLHDEIRGVAGSYEEAVGAIRRARDLGLNVSANTVLNARNPDDLPELLEVLCDAGIRQWQLQLAVAMGNAVDHDDLLLQPYQLLELMPLLARVYRRAEERDVLLIAGNNVGYFGPYEHLWRSFDDDYGHWTGCPAGQTAIGLEADGTVKGCPSLATQGYGAGNVRDLTIEDIWHTREEIHFGRTRPAKSLWGFCSTCYYAPHCRGGCTWTADSLFGRPGNNPYCHHRALELDRLGLRERVVKTQEAPDAAFAIGRFDLVLEAVPGREDEAREHLPRMLREHGGDLVRLGGPRTWGLAPEDEPGRQPERLVPCRACHRHVWARETDCPHCGADLAEAQVSWLEGQARRQALMDEVLRWTAEQASRPMSV